MGLGDGDQSVVRGVLTLPGIVGLACLDRVRPIQVYCWDRGLAIQNPDVFVTSVTRVLQSMPSEFYQLEFAFGTYCVTLRRFITGDAIALITQTSVDLQAEERGLAAFCRVMMDHRSAVLAEIQVHQQMMQEIFGGQGLVSQSDGSGVSRSVMIQAFNRLAEIAGRYLGTAIMARHLTRSRPLVACLDGVTIDRRGKLEMPANPQTQTSSTQTSSTHKSGLDELTNEQRSAFSMWIQEFTQQCSKIIRNFDTLVRQEGLTEEEITILFDSDP